MSGQSTLQTYQRREPSGAPFPANAAYNGLSVDTVTGQIVLGQDVGDVTNPAAFVSNRVIPMAGFDLQIFGNDETDAIPWLQWQTLFGNVNGRFGSSDFNGNRGTELIWQLPLSPLASNILDLQSFTVNEVMALRMRHTDALGADASFNFDDGINGNQIGMFLDFLNQLFQLGDTNDVFNGNKVSIDDAGQRWEIGQKTAITNLLLNFPAAAIGLSFFDSVGNNPFLLPDPGTGGIAFMTAPDFATQLALSDAGNGRLAQLGNVGAGNNGNVFTVDDANGLFDITNTALNAVVRMNGVNGFTGVVAPVNTITVDGGIVTNVA